MGRGKEMKKIMLITVIVLSIGCVQGWTSFFGLIPDIKTDITNLKNSTQKSLSDIQAGVNSNKTGINDVSNAQIKTDTELGVVKGNILKLDAKLNATASAQVGMQNQITTMGNNNKVNSGNTNDSGLLKYIFHILSAIFLAVITALGAVLKAQGTTIDNLTDKANKLEQERDAQYSKLVDGQSQLINDLLKSKDDYKTRYLDIVGKK